MSRGIWKTVETEAEKTGVAKTKGRRVKEVETERTEERRKKKGKKTKKGENNKSKEDSRRMGNLK